MSVEMLFGGQSFTIAGRSVADVQAEIDGILLSGMPGWVQAYDGHGGRSQSLLLITPGVSVALVEFAEG
ncbi:hypothetical protein LK09_07420 [Microbacterium mangrovi]|uniref:Uncharacterized protein n=1 Tax=Microbacterium mangrovi TaxID=1348253 RepID=A0A0B2A5G3_9MICO|nr:hypothetical protein [Microbacterium mangrovi]KHK98739.1 hypothetical protein LK09_07420 [Microbacterium mangrovi]